MTMNEMKRAIVESFENWYGFAPAMKNIIPLETSSYGNSYEWMGFRVGKVGYQFDKANGVNRCECYDAE